VISLGAWVVCEKACKAAQPPRRDAALGGRMMWERGTEDYWSACRGDPGASPHEKLIAKPTGNALFCRVSNATSGQDCLPRLLLGPVAG
jgi:hypothetical protein